MAEVFLKSWGGSEWRELWCRSLRGRGGEGRGGEGLEPFRIVSCMNWHATSHPGHPRVTPEEVVRKVRDGVVVECSVQEGPVGGAGGWGKRQKREWEYGRGSE